ncbi:hypothetical protein [Actinoplanes sp. NPDC089786]|uniref:hypothetical protein n=1 Tax=Actinoplanes sp. NPDC089786 TaxID=3155185 RepID=UPI003423DD78
MGGVGVLGHRVEERAAAEPRPADLTDDGGGDRPDRVDGGQIAGRPVDVPADLLVWGVWAVVAGVIQLAVGLSRRRLGGQWAMIVSGAGSVLAGSGFAIMSGQNGAGLTNLAGYAVVGGVFFLISALRLGRAARTAKAV